MAIMIFASDRSSCRPWCAVPDTTLGFPEIQRINNLAALLLDTVPGLNRKSFGWACERQYNLLSFFYHSWRKVKSVLPWTKLHLEKS